MKKYFLLLSIFISTIEAKSQTILDTIDPTYQNAALRGVSTDKDIIGSQYLFDEWSLGSIVLRSGEIHSNQQIKYDAYNDDLVVQGVNNNEIVINKSLISEFSLKRELKNLQFVKVKMNDKVEFLQKLVDGDVTLMKQTRKKIEEAKEISNSGYANTNQKQDKVVLLERYYHKTGNSFILIPRKKKDLAKLFGKYEQSIASYIKEKKLQTNKEADLIEIFNFANRLN